MHCFKEQVSVNFCPACQSIGEFMAPTIAATAEHEIIFVALARERKEKKRERRRNAFKVIIRLPPTNIFAGRTWLNESADPVICSAFVSPCKTETEMVFPTAVCCTTLAPLP